MDSIAQTIKGLFPPDLWDKTLAWFVALTETLVDNGLRLALIAVAVFLTVQIIKRTFKVSDKLPTLGWKSVHLISLACSAGWSYTLLDGVALDDKAAFAVFGWALAWAIAAYGMGLLQMFAPRLYRVIEAEDDRRRQDSGPPVGTVDRRRQP